MHRILLFLALMGAGEAVTAQYIYTIKADSVKITNSCDTAELIIENHTQTVPGFLFNKGKGRTEFRKGAVKLNDSMYLVGADTIYIPRVNAVNGASIANGKVMLGNGLGETSATLLNTREIPLNNNNVVFTGNGKIGVGTNAPRDLIEIASPISRQDSGTANIRFTYLGEPDRYSNLIWNALSGNPLAHRMGFSLTSGGNTITPLVLAGDSRIYQNGHVMVAGDIGVNISSHLYPNGPLDLRNFSTPTDAKMILFRYDDAHYHAIKASFHGTYPSQNKIQFFLCRDTTDTPTINPLNLIGDGNAIFNGNIGVQNTSPSAHIHVGAGASAAGGAPIKLTAGSVLTTPEDGAIEFDGTDLYLTENSTRYKLAKTIGGQLNTNFGVASLAAFDSRVATLTVAGAQPNDVVTVSANSGSVNSRALIITAYVTSANTVTLQAYNASNSTVTIASDTYKVRVIK